MLNERGVNPLPNIASQIKRVRTNKKSTLANNSQTSAMRTAIKKFEAENAEELLRAAHKAIDGAASKGLIHKNKASRDKSRLASKLSK